MTINNIRIFIEVYKTLNITAASKSLHITQPVISRTIKGLEEEYETVFFDRLQKKLVPTEEGTLFFQRMSRILSDIDNVKADLENKKENATVRIGAAIMIGNFLIPEICESIKEDYPGLNIKVHIAPANELKKMILNDELDFALIEDNLHDVDLKYIPFYKDKMVPILPLNHPLSKKKGFSLKDMSEYPLLLREEGSATRIYVNTIFESSGIIPNPAWESTSTQAILRGVGKGLGLSVLPQKFVSRYINENRITTGNLREKLPERTCFIIYHKDKVFLPIYDSLFKIIDQVAEQA